MILSMSGAKREMVVLLAILFGIIAVCVATYSPQSTSDTSFLNHVFESDYTKKQCLFVLSGTEFC